MKIDFNENILKSFDEFEEMFTHTGMAFTNMGEEGEIFPSDVDKIVDRLEDVRKSFINWKSDADKIVDRLEDVRKSFINWKKDVICILVNNAIIEAEEEKEVHEEEEEE